MPNPDLESQLPAVLRAFYARVRADDQLGPIFNGAVHDWDEHLERIGDFWSSVVLGTRRYKGDPVAKHLRHADDIDQAKFERWLALWAETTNAMLPIDQAEALQGKASRIAESLHLAIRFASPAQNAMTAGKQVPPT